MKKGSSRVSRGLASHRRGRWAEYLCCFVLLVKGYRILERRYKTRMGEIDIIAQRGLSLVFIEVKARPSVLLASEAISEEQLARLSRAAGHFLAHWRGASSYHIRLDAMLVCPWRWPRHIVNAFPFRE